MGINALKKFQKVLETVKIFFSKNFLLVIISVSIYYSSKNSSLFIDKVFNDKAVQHMIQ